MKYCRTCALQDRNGKRCMLNNLPVTSEDYCSKHRETLYKCANCSTPLLPETSIICEENIILCEKCHDILNGCFGCQYGRVCEFQTNPDPMPRVVTQTARAGNTVMQTQAKNPARIEKFCFNCSCWNKEEKECMKEKGCLNWVKI